VRLLQHATPGPVPLPTVRGRDVITRCRGRIYSTFPEPSPPPNSTTATRRPLRVAARRYHSPRTPARRVSSNSATANLVANSAG
jgi:hypothetical protein